ncbi:MULTISPECIES: hypothetical protein [unclassified Mesorhizobium]|uniref:hypothetical protein n=1 Tax=unclassified Mesorhizobium TaxID=325217 RepID=UPI001678D8B1|nr:MULTISPECIES: hypothetical protein [unclassified Mesorhizobium]
MKPITVSNTAWPAVISDVGFMAFSFGKQRKTSTYPEQYGISALFPPPENRLVAPIAGCESLV